jgi:hypothetical protein
MAQEAHGPIIDLLRLIRSLQLGDLGVAQILADPQPGRLKRRQAEGKPPIQVHVDPVGGLLLKAQARDLSSHTTKKSYDPGHP